MRKADDVRDKQLIDAVLQTLRNNEGLLLFDVAKEVIDLVRAWDGAASEHKRIQS